MTGIAFSAEVEVSLMRLALKSVIRILVRF